jgi:hypothetical protein
MTNSDKFEILIHKAWEDPEFRKMLNEHPENALHSLGIEVPEGKKIIVHQDTESLIHICISEKPKELSENDLKKIHAGLSTLEKVGIGLGAAATLAGIAASVYYGTQGSSTYVPAPGRMVNGLWVEW